jgi:NitT/TauT family transport system permease protein
VYQLNVYPPTLFPSLRTIFSELVSGIIDFSIINSAKYSLSILFKGIFLTFLLAFLSVLLSELSCIFNDFLEMLITIAHPLPGIAIIPLVILWIGIGEKALLFIVIHAMLWPVIINLKSGIKSIPSIYIDLSRVFNFSEIEKIRHIYFMGILPHIFSGLKIAWARGWRALISSEMVFGVVGTASGLGWYIFKQRVFMNTAGLYAGLTVIIILGLIVEGIIFEKVENIMIGKWR